MGWSPRTISVDNDVWEKAKKAVKKETGMNMSKFIQVWLNGAARAKKGDLKGVMAGCINDLIEMDDSLSAREKLKGFKVVDEAHKKLINKKKT
jgi:hypothetical protein